MLINGARAGTANGMLVVGESLVDVVVTTDGSVREHAGGSPANVALGLARLGHQVHLLTRTGDDAYGALVRGHLYAAGVKLVGTSVDDDPTSTATAVLDANGTARYKFDLVWRLPEIDPPEDVLVVHTGSIGAYLEPGAANVERILRGAYERSTISYDPNVRPALASDRSSTRARVETIVATSDVVKVSDEDLAWLAPEKAPDAIAADWLELGPSIVVVTHGGNGATGVSRAGVVDVPAWQVAVVDTVGAGDAFSAGLLDALADADLLGRERHDDLRQINTSTLRRILEHATRTSAFVCTRAGAQAPTRAELAAWPDSLLPAAKPN